MSYLPCPFPCFLPGPLPLPSSFYHHLFCHRLSCLTYLFCHHLSCRDLCHYLCSSFVMIFVAVFAIIFVMIFVADLFCLCHDLCRGHICNHLFYHDLCRSHVYNYLFCYPLLFSFLSSFSHII